MRRPVPVCVAGTVAAVLFGLSPLLRPDRVGRGDWGKELAEAAAAREAVLVYRELPVWNRYCGGGNPLLGNPETLAPSPFFLLVLLLGPVTGLKASIAAHALLGAWGAARLCRDRGAAPEEAALGAVLWALTGTTAMHVAVGHVQWQAAALLPFMLRPLCSPGYPGLRGAMAALAVAILDGGAHVTVMGVVGMAALAILDGVRTRRPSALAIAAGLCLSGGLLAGVRLAPSLVLWRREPHLVASHAGYGLRLLVESLFLRVADPAATVAGVDTGEGGGFWEYGAYLGVLSLPLVLLAVARGWRTLVPEACLAVTGLVLAIEPPGGLGPWEALHALPPFSSQRRPSRFVLLVALAWAIAAARGLHAARRRPLLALGLGVLAAGDAALAARATYGAAAVVPVAVPRDRGEFESRRGGSVHANLLEGAGTIPCRAGLHVPQHAAARGDEDYRGEAYLAEGDGEARLVVATSRSFTVRYDAPGGGLLVLNQNDAPGWLVEGGVLARHLGLVAARVPPGSGTVVFRQAYDTIFFGAAVSALWLVASMGSSLGWWRAGGRPGDDGDPGTRDG